ncbi:MAG: metal ABC transporter substrate-binding protein [Firmicutes bacterium]|nr:metal ABC transporter substrate-binding protein [Bacillota bacterium]
MKKIYKRLFLTLAIIFACVPALFVFSGCNNRDRDPDIVVTVFPLYDWTRVILGDNPSGLTVRYLLSSGVDLHNYQPSVQDFAAISTTSLFLWIGGKSDGWALNALANPRNSDRRDVALMRLLSLDETMLFPELDGPDAPDECCGGANHDEHVWLSLRFAMRFVQTIRDEIILLDPQNADVYYANAAYYIEQLQQLDTQFEYVVENAPRDTILVADRFPFLYLAVDYGINFFAAFDGCAALVEVTPARLAFLAGRVDALALDVILIVDNRPLANAVINASNRTPQILTLTCFQSVSSVHISAGKTYLDGMRANLEALAKALDI